MNDSFSSPEIEHAGLVGVFSVSRNVALLLQLLVLLGTAMTVFGLFAWPSTTEVVLWSIIIPLLPASFLISPSLWRAVCPLATLNMLGNGTFGSKRVSKKDLFKAEIIGIALLLILVPARRFVLNENGPVLAVLVAVIAVAALVLGFFYASKAGFCNTICPVLPVEKLYGQNPIMSVKNPRCIPCDACTLKGCYDLGPAKSVKFALRGNGDKNPTWKTTSFGLFAAGFPGFIIGYFSVSDVALTEASMVYGTILGYMLVSSLVFQLFFSLTKTRNDVAILILGTLSVGLYYWFSGPAIATALVLDPAVGTGIRVATLTLVGFWAFRGLRRTRTIFAAPADHNHPASF